MANETELKKFSLGNLEQVLRLAQTTFATKKELNDLACSEDNLYISSRGEKAYNDLEINEIINI